MAPPPASVPVPSSKLTIQVFSDLHLEIQDTYTSTSGFHPSVLPSLAPYLFLAGDIGTLVLPHQRLRFQTWLTSLCQNHKYVFYVAGNHEYWYGSIEDGNKEMKRLAGLECMKGRLVGLEKGRFNFEDVVGEGKVRVSVLGGALWSRLIAEQGKLPRGRLGDAMWIRGDSVSAHTERFEESYSWLKNQVQNIRKEDLDSGKARRKIVVLTHYCPTLLGSTLPENEMRGSWSNWQTDILGGEGVEGLGGGDAWIHGHTHFSHDGVVDGVRVIANSRGIPSERSLFDVNKTYEI